MYWVRKSHVSHHYAHLAKGSILYGNVCGLYNMSHPGFHLVYANVEGQTFLFQRILDNLNRPNPLSMDELEFPIEIESCPKDDDPNWFHSPIGEIDNLSQELPFAIPEIQEDEVGNCMIGFTGGPYKLRMSHHYVSLCQRVEIEKKLTENEGNNFHDFDAFIQACKEFPKDMILHLKHFESFGDAWNEDMLGPFPRSGVIAIYARIPSANRTIHSEKSFKHSMILIAEEGQRFLKFDGPLSHVVGWRCSSFDSTPDPGSR